MSTPERLPFPLPQRASLAKPVETSAPDRALVARAQAGDRDAFGALYDRHVQTIARYVAARIPNDDDVEDVTE
ncbi:MAG: hypothetical protein NZ518_08110, partial [Dehalococcoidia bacterium]|nr:hypothetical protein [Dehalococcoidia bacterium]